MITEDKITEIFCMTNDFCKFFDAMTAKYALKPAGRGSRTLNLVYQEAPIRQMQGHKYC